MFGICRTLHSALARTFGPSTMNTVDLSPEEIAAWNKHMEEMEAERSAPLENIGELLDDLYRREAQEEMAQQDGRETAEGDRQLAAEARYWASDFAPED